MSQHHSCLPQWSHRLPLPSLCLHSPCSSQQLWSLLLYSPHHSNQLLLHHRQSNITSHNHVFIRYLYPKIPGKDCFIPVFLSLLYSILHPFLLVFHHEHFTFGSAVPSVILGTVYLTETHGLGDSSRPLPLTITIWPHHFTTIKLSSI